LLAQTGKALLGRRTASRFRGQFSEGGLAVMDAAVRRRQGAALPEVGMTLGAGNLRQHLRSQLMDYGFNQILNYEDFSSMSQGIEIRSPFIDYRLMEFAFALPDEAKFHRGVTKRIVRDAFRRDLPASIVDEKVKIGFRMPFEDWVRKPAMRALIEDVVSRRSFRESGLWDADALARQLRDPAAAALGFPVWRFLVTQLWLDRQSLSVG
jgi:asparagine synthase (glutamine-hydrolysing)